MLYKDGKIIPYLDLSQEEKAVCYVIAKLTIIDNFNNGSFKGGYIKKNLGILLGDSELTQGEFQQAMHILHMINMQMAFEEEKQEIGFKKKEPCSDEVSSSHMLYSGKRFKKFQNLSEEEKEICYLLTKLGIMDAFKLGILKGDFLRDNLGNILKNSDISQAELQNAMDTLYSVSMKMVFGKERIQLGFIQKNSTLSTS